MRASDKMDSCNIRAAPQILQTSARGPQNMQTAAEVHSLVAVYTDEHEIARIKMQCSAVAILAQANLYGFFACLFRHVPMEPSVTALVAETHGEAMRMIGSLVGQHLERGNQAARVLEREKKISPATSRRLDCLATTYSIARHIDVVMCRDFLRDLELQLRAGPQNRVYNQVNQEQIAAGVTTENIAKIPVVQEQVTVQEIPEAS